MRIAFSNQFKTLRNSLVNKTVLVCSAWLTKVLIIACTSILIPTSMTVAQGWAAQTSGTSLSLDAVYFVDANTGWAVGTAGNILKTTDGGTTWSFQTSGTTRNLQSVWFLDASTGWVTGQHRILKTTDGGMTWSTVNVQERTYQKVHFIDASTGWTTNNGKLWKSTDGGATWTAQTIPIGYTPANVHFVNPSTGWAVGGNGGILKTTDGGMNWTAQTSGTSSGFFWVHFVDASNGWAVGVGGTIVRTTNGGTTWTVQTSGTSSSLYEVHSVDANTGYAVGENVGGVGILLSTTDGGTNWAAQTTGTSSILRSVSFVNASDGWVVGNDGTILRKLSTPAAPTNLAATPCGSQVAISFTAGSNGGSPITNYQYSLDGTNWTTLSPAVTGTTVTVTALISGTYNISLRAVNSVGSGAASASVTCTINTNVAISYTGATIVTATNKSAPITLSAAVTLPGCATASQAELRFINRDSGQPISGWLSITPGTPSNTGTATYPHILTLGTNEIFRKYNIGIEIGGAGIFTRNSSADNVIVTVAEPSCGCY